MKEQYVRTAMLLGEDGIETLQKKRVAIFGLGGVGGYVAEALARSGVGALDLIDHDTVAESNLNRQIIATYDTIGRLKTEVMKERIESIRKDCVVRLYPEFYLPEKAEEFPFAEYDYVVDAIDTVTAKIDLAVRMEEMGIPLISCMGTGNKLNPALLEVADIYETSVCPLAKVMRRELKKRSVKKLKVVYSKEEALTPISLTQSSRTEEGKVITDDTEQGRTDGRKATPGSTAFVPASAGLLIASEVIKDLWNTGEDK